MKKFLLLILTILGVGQTSNYHVLRVNSDVDLLLKAKSHILMDYDSGEILFEHDANIKLYPASMTKMMGMLLVLEEIDNGKLKWEDKVKGSETSSSMGGTQIFLAPNEEMSVDDLFKAVAINSANDAIVALGEKVSGSHTAFVNKMNERAKQLNMVDTNFCNATGFDDEQHVTTSLDMALLARELLTHEEDILRYSKMKEAYLREDSSNPFWLVNTNKLLGHYEGLDGLKTGYTNKAGYNLTATAYRNGVRLISVTMNASTIKERTSDTISLLNYGFSKLKAIPLFEKDVILGYYTFDRALKKNTPLYSYNCIKPVYPSNVNKDDLSMHINLNKCSAPLLKETIVGELVISDKSGKEKRYPVYIKEDIESKEYFDYFLDSLKSIFA